MRFNFPRTKFADKNSLKEQIEHMFSELVEVSVALENGESPDVVAMELMDLGHSTETGLFICREQYGCNLSLIRRDVERKNLARGYYDKA